MAAVRIEEEAFSDQRIVLLGTIAGYNQYEALGRLAYLWRHCTHKETHTVSMTVVRATLGPRGVEALIESDLGERVNDGVRVKGTGGRIEWLMQRRAAAQAGGKQAATKRQARAQANDEQTPSTEQPNALPLALAPSVAVAPAGADEEAARDGARARRSKPESIDGYQATVDAFHVRYSAAYGGAKPTWTNKQGAIIKRLLKAHGAAEVQRRINVMFDSPPTWLKGPFDVGTLAQHFDKFVSAPDAPPSGSVGRFDPSMNPKDDDNNTPPWEL